LILGVECRERPEASWHIASLKGAEEQPESDESTSVSDSGVSHCDGAPEEHEKREVDLWRGSVDEVNR
jgi:hypothetical protein